MILKLRCIPERGQPDENSLALPDRESGKGVFRWLRLERSKNLRPSVGQCRSHVCLKELSEALQARPVNVMNIHDDHSVAPE